MKRARFTVGIDACCWSNQRGFGRYTRQLVRAMLRYEPETRYVLFVDRHTARTTTLPDGAHVVVVPTRQAPTEAASAGGHRSFADLVALAGAVRRQPFSVFFFPSHYTYVPLLTRRPILVGIHDISASIHPEEHYSSHRNRWMATIKERAAILQATHVVTPSEASRRQICDAYPTVGKRIRVIGHGSTQNFQPLPRSACSDLAAYGLAPNDRFMLHVGGLNPIKRIPQLIDSFADWRLKSGISDVSLLCIGENRDDPYLSDMAAIRTRIAARGLEGQVRLIGYVPDEHLVQFYNAATVLVFPSEGEGFGLPVIEAMACGTPTLASNRGALPEVVGDSGRLFDPSLPGDLERGMTAFFTNPAGLRDLRARCLSRIQRFSWKQAASETVALLENLAREADTLVPVRPGHDRMKI